jgi:2-polyprenyl-3-methyl-5-hydroxy-6-metoxy-1,4-benzoquinol methylase
MRRKLRLLVEGNSYPTKAFRSMWLIWRRMDNRFKLTKTARVTGGGERLFVEDWQSAVHSHDATVLSHIHRYLWVQQYLKNLVCLDAGCGAGYGTHHLAVNGVNKIIGVDKSTEAMKYDQKKFRAANLEFRQMDVTKLDFVSGAFDAVISFDVLEHLNEVDQHRFMAETARVLNPNGTAYFGCPNGKRIALWWPNPFHLRELLQEEFELLLKQYFRNVTVLGQDIMYKGVRQKESRETKVPNLSLSNFIVAYDDYLFGFLSICKQPIQTAKCVGQDVLEASSQSQKRENNRAKGFQQSLSRRF